MIPSPMGDFFMCPFLGNVFGRTINHKILKIIICETKACGIKLLTNLHL